MFSTKSVVIVCVGLFVGLAAVILTPKPLPEMSRQDLIAEVQSGVVHDIVVTDEKVITGDSTTRGPFRVPLGPDDKTLIDTLIGMGAEVTYKTTAPGLI